MFVRRASSRGRGAGEKHMSLGVAVSRHGVCGGQVAVGVGAGEKHMLLGVAVGRHCVCARGGRGRAATSWRIQRASTEFLAVSRRVTRAFPSSSSVKK